MTFETSWCTLKVDDSNMYALMKIHTPNCEEKLNLTDEFVLNFLSEQKIIHGINPIAIGAMLENVQYEQFLCVAKGTMPTRGQDGYYDYKKDTSDIKKPKILEDGTVDYKNALSLAVINKGELLAVYIPPTNGSEGLDIYGNTVPSLGNGRELLPLRGRGIVPDENNINYYAEYTGHIVQNGNKLYIDKVYTVNGDLNIEVGNIRFDGDVEVFGDVRSGYGINASGNVTIHGHVGACQIISGKNITIEKGIQGRGTGLISAAGDIVCKFVESCKLNAGGCIYADSILNSTAIAAQQVLVISKHGIVVSSEVYGMTGVIVNEAGNSAGTHTLLRAGLPREYYEKAMSLSKQIQEADTKIAAFNHHLEALETSNQDSSKAADIRMQIIRARIVLSTQRNAYAEELTTLEEKIKTDNQNSFINITGTVYEGVRIYIGTSPYVVNEAVREVSFRLLGGAVNMQPLTDSQACQ